MLNPPHLAGLLWTPITQLRCAAGVGGKKHGQQQGAQSANRNQPSIAGAVAETIFPTLSTIKPGRRGAYPHLPRAEQDVLSQIQAKAAGRSRSREARPPAEKKSHHRRVGEGDCSPPPPTDPDVRDYRIRLLVSWSSYARAAIQAWLGVSNGKRLSKATKRSQMKVRWFRRLSHLNQIRLTT